MQVSTNPRPPKMQDEIVIVKLWEIYLLYHPANLYKTFTEFSLDNGPLEDRLLSGKVIFRFTTHDWQNTIRELLYQHRIPVNLQSNPLAALKIKGCLPALR